MGVGVPPFVWSWSEFSDSKGRLFVFYFPIFDGFRPNANIPLCLERIEI